MDTPTKLSFDDPGALDPIPEEAQAPFTGREGECPNPSDGRANSLPTPTKLPFDDPGALNPISEEAQALSTGKKGSTPTPAMGP